MTIGSRILNERYRLGEVLGHGGMAVVYRAEDMALGRTVAVKILREQYSTDPEFLERFRREARAAAALSHPNIVTVYDVGREGSTNYMVMEYVDGVDLKEIIADDGPLPPARLVQLGCQLAAALEYAHRQGLVHRDIKPQNVLVTQDDHVKVGDFGIAVALGARSITQTGMVIGSVHYMAPEQAQGQPSTPASDVYALGCVLYEMATGRLPFEAESPLAVARLQIERAPTPPQRLNPRLPAPIADVILRAMAKDPRARFQSAAEVAAALRGQRARAGAPTAAVAAAPASAQTTERTRRMPAAAARAAPPSGLTRHIARGAPARRGRGFGLLSFFSLALLLAILGAGIGWFLGNPPNLSTSRPTPAPVVVASPSPQPAAVTPTREPTPSPPPKPAQPTPTPQPPTPTPAPPTATPTTAPRPTASPTPAPPSVQVPALVGRPEAEATRQLQQAGLGVEVREERSSDAPNGVVVAQNPPPGTRIAQGQKVTITVGRPAAAPKPKPKSGEQGTRVPNVEGMDERQARRTLEGAGFRVQVEEEASDDRKGQVINQNPGAGDTVPPGSTVRITIAS